MKRVEADLAQFFECVRRLRCEFNHLRFFSGDAARSHVFKIHTISVNEDLSVRELQILRLMAQGMSLTAMGRKAHLSVKTVCTYMVRLQDKFGVSSNHELRCVAALLFARVEVI